MRAVCVLPLAVLLATLASSAPARAAGRELHGASDASARSDARPISVTAQLDYCRRLAGERADAVTLRRCLRYAERILDEGMRSRRRARGAEFEEQLASGARDIEARLDRLSRADGEHLAGQLRDLDAAIASLRARLSNVAAAERMQLSLVSRGGVSLGNWQAGFLYAVTEWAKTRPGQRSGPAGSDPAFSTVTGASAGAVNGFAAAVEGCQRPEPVASESLYYRVWMNLGLFGRHGTAGLFPGPEGGATPLSLFSDEALEAALERARGYIARAEQLPGCHVDFGFVATHLAPAQSPVHVRQDGSPILTTKKLKEKFAVRLSFDDVEPTDASGPRTSPTITNIGPTGAFRDDQIYYAALGHSRDVPLESLLLAVRASAAFPGAFPPVALTYTQYVPGPDATVVSRKKVGTFIDGGILDNTPVGLAVALDQWRGEPAHPNPYLDGLLPPDPRTYIFLEPLVESWVRGGADRAGDGARGHGLLSTYLAFSRDLLATTTDAQLTNTAEQYSFVRRESRDWTRPRLSVPERHMPITGEQFDHFMAFLERDFRIFDFYVGMADAHAYLQREECLLEGRAGTCDPDGSVRRLDAVWQEANPDYRCIRAYYDSEQSRVLKSITTADLPPECRELAAVDCDQPGAQDGERAVGAFIASGAISDEAGSDRCVETSVANHNFRVLLAAMHNYKVWMQSDQYSKAGEIDRFFEELGRGGPSERFIYLDLATYLGRKDAYLGSDEAKQAFRALVQKAINRISAEQKGLSRYALELGGRAAADAAYGREYPRQVVGLGVVQNGLELVYGRRLVAPTWRWDSTFRYFNLQQQSYARGLEPFTSDFYLSTQATWILSPARFADLELGAGWAATETIAYNSASPGHVDFRTGPRTFVGLVLLQRIYLALNVDYYPVKTVGAAYRDTGTKVADDWEFNIAGGWRFLF